MASLAKSQAAFIDKERLSEVGVPEGVQKELLKIAVGDGIQTSMGCRCSAGPKTIIHQDISRKIHPGICSENFPLESFP